MNLSNVQIVNFRNYSSTTFNFFGGANTIIGENDSGKSNALTAIRMLLDDSFYYSTKSLKESDFNKSLGNFRGHWIIISAEFENISDEESDKEVIATLREEISNASLSKGNACLIIRPNVRKRQELYDASENIFEFEDVRNSIRLSDYEFIYRGKMTTDFTDPIVYKEVVGDFENFTAPDPKEKQENDQYIGSRVDIKDINEHISVVFIDALRDVLRTVSSTSNPIKRIVEEIEDKISDSEFEDVKNKIKDLNESITDIEGIGDIKSDINNKLVDILGLVYSPDLSLSSNISDDLTSLSRFLKLRPQGEEDMNSLGLGHLNMIFIALKIVEYNKCSFREVLNIMLIEEPEAHIHHHIQRTLFQNLGIKDKSTQVIMTTHSPNIAESSEISRMNIVKSFNGFSVAMNPSKNLDSFGEDFLNTKISLSKSIERYLDAKRSTLLFSKGVILVEGDAEEILIPNLVKNSLGVSLDEIGIGLINVGSTAFEYIASLFSNERINRKCAVITDMDEQMVPMEIIIDERQKDGTSEKKLISNKLYKKGAAKKGKERKVKLDKLFQSNEWVKAFYAGSTFEIELAKVNDEIFSNVPSQIYEQESTITKWENKLSYSNDIFFEEELVATSDQVKCNAVLSLAENTGKGWLATIVAQIIAKSEEKYVLPEYIIDAIAFVSSESVSEKVVKKMIVHNTAEEIEIEDFLGNHNYKNDYPCLISFIKKWKKMEMFK
ncbi:ATP-dependent endonuclease [Enterococcus sp. JM4C]|uniref:ATP-dependent nuclease n=1 Tax=Candidatus Enterococcus huntleyi TaxID=1857217 RepID=UPI001379A3A2|nr:AAA family ATPase [Enterococcus sp. JM4C]KAF1299346.1 ATP-dependent endonuclease [Enterococcus sp. JM4C]